MLWENTSELIRAVLREIEIETGACSKASQTCLFWFSQKLLNYRPAILLIFGHFETSSNGLVSMNVLIVTSP